MKEQTKTIHSIQFAIDVLIAVAGWLSIYKKR